MKSKVYIETSFISYLAAKPTPNIVARARQEITRLWWKSRASSFELVTSKLTEIECGRGDRSAAAKRVGFLASMPLLSIDESVDQLAQAFLVPGAIPEKATEDAVHLAICAIHTIHSSHGIFATWQTHESNSVWNTFAPSRDIGYLRFAHLNNYERPRPRPDFTTSPHGQRRHLL